MNVYLKALSETMLQFFVVVAGLYYLRGWFQNSRDEPRVLLRKIIITTLFLGFTYFVAVFLGIREYVAGQGNPAFALFPFVIVGLGFVLSILWAPNIGEWLLRPITNLLDGGQEELEPKPYYSIARGLRAKGRYEQAIGKIEKQLEKFPGDFEGLMLCAEIQVENLHDLAAAEATLEIICTGSKQSAQHIAAALNTLADWHLKFARDHVAARHDLERLVELFPGSEAALGAAQRIAHLGAEEKPWSLRERRKVFVPEGIKNYGLMDEKVDFAPPEIKPEEQAGQLVSHLNNHPLDIEAREKLALLYADHYQRPELAADQLEQMIAQPNASIRSVTHWLNLLADLHVRCSDDYDAARQTLQRIVDRFPNSPVSEIAQNRIELLRLELKAKQKSQAVRLGSYEQNIGLKYGAPRRH